MTEINKPNSASSTRSAVQASLPRPNPASLEAALTVRNLIVSFGELEVLKGITMDIPSRAVTAIIGPSGCGKSTFLRAINRMHDLVPSARVQGEVCLFGENIY